MGWELRMDAKDIWLLLAGAVLGYPVALLATFTTPPLSNAFSKFKSGFIERNKAKALAAYAFVYDLKTGKRDKYLYAINSWGMLTALMLVAIAAWSLGLATGRETRGVLGRPEENALSLILLVTAIPLGLTLMAASRIMYLFLTLNRVDNFEAYRASLLRRWPGIKLPDAD
jgi:hypothetical protein